VSRANKLEYLFIYSRSTVEVKRSEIMVLSMEEGSGDSADLRDILGVNTHNTCPWRGMSSDGHCMS
jgi:hypothetical protein